MDSQDRLSVAEKLGYGMGDAACGIVYSSVTMFLTYFYTDIYGISAAAVGTMFLLTRIFDAVIDPVVGLIADRTRTRWGHFRPWLLWFAIPYAVIAVLAYTTPDLMAGGKLVYAYITYFLLMLFYTCVNIPYCSLGGVLTHNDHERLSAQSYRFTISSCASLFVSVCTLGLVDYLGGTNKQLGYQETMAIMGGVAIVMLLFCFFSTKERVLPINTEKVTVSRDLKMLLANDQWRIVACIMFFSSMAGVMRGAATLYYATYLMVVPGQGLVGTIMKSSFITVSVVGTIFGAMLAGYFAKRYAAIALFKIINMILVILGVIMFFIPPVWLVAVFPLYFLIGFFHQMYQPFKWNMIADSADYGEWKFGRRITALAFSGNLFTLKLGMAIAGALVGFSLGFFGYVAGSTTQTHLATIGIISLLTIGPSLSYLILYGLIHLYKLDVPMMDKIHADLAQRRLIQRAAAQINSDTEMLADDIHPVAH